MKDREKVIKGMEMCISPDECSPDECPYYIRPNNESGLCWDRLMTDALALLKEQEAVVRCKDCKHRPIKPNDYENGFDLEFPDGKCPCQCDDGWYSWYPPDDWFCADGERRAENED